MSLSFENWLDDSHKDQLKELVNLAMGDGAKALSTVTQRFIKLCVPQVNQLLTQDLIGQCKFASQENFCCCVQEYSALGQTGWLLIVINPQDLAYYATLLDRDCVDEADHENILVQLTGVIAPVILPRIAKELRVSLKLGEVQPILGLSRLPAVGKEGVSAANLTFSYAVEPSPVQLEAEKVAPSPAFDVIMRAPTDLIKQLADKFSTRLDALF
jgi:hypothetical protein